MVYISIPSFVRLPVLQQLTLAMPKIFKDGSFECRGRGRSSSKESEKTSAEDSGCEYEGDVPAAASRSIAGNVKPGNKGGPWEDTEPDEAEVDLLDQPPVMSKYSMSEQVRKRMVILQNGSNSE